jgi:predicted flap endonuclease-1-like 5' DNA nuclease
LRTDNFAIGSPLRSQPVLYRSRFTPRPGAQQVEVRFVAVFGSIAVIADASLAAGSDVLDNADLRLTGRNGFPERWTLDPTEARGVFRADIREDSVRLSNAGSQTASLVQVIEIDPERPLQLEFDGVLLPPGDGSADIVVRFLRSDGEPAGGPSVLSLRRNAFRSHRAALTTPLEAARAEVRIVLGPKTSIDLGTLRLGSDRNLAVPLTFIAQAPGNMRVSNARVAYDILPAAPPAPPAGGIFAATPPDRTPADDVSGGECWCCGKRGVAQQAKSALTPSGQSASVAICPTCATPAVRIGGSNTAEGVVRRLPTIDVTKTSALRSMSAQSDLPLTAIRGIGAKRGKALSDAGMATVEDVASATPEAVAAALRGFSVADASVIIQHAKELLASTPPSSGGLFS